MDAFELIYGYSSEIHVMRVKQLEYDYANVFIVIVV